MLGCTTSLTFQSFRSVFTCNLAKPGLSFFYVIIYFEFNRSFFLSESKKGFTAISETIWTKQIENLLLAKSTQNLQLAKWEAVICEEKICNLRNENPCCKLHRPRGWIDQFVTSVDCKPNVAYNLNYKYNLNPKLIFFWFYSIFEYFCRKKRAMVWDNFYVFMLNIQVNILQSTRRRFSFRSQVVISCKITFVNHAGSELTDSSF